MKEETTEAEQRETEEKSRQMKRATEIYRKEEGDGGARRDKGGLINGDGGRRGEKQRDERGKMKVWHAVNPQM